MKLTNNDDVRTMFSICGQYSFEWPIELGASLVKYFHDIRKFDLIQDIWRNQGLLAWIDQMKKLVWLIRDLVCNYVVLLYWIMLLKLCLLYVLFVVVCSCLSHIFLWNSCLTTIPGNVSWLPFLATSINYRCWKLRENHRCRKSNLLTSVRGIFISLESLGANRWPKRAIF